MQSFFLNFVWIVENQLCAISISNQSKVAYWYAIYFILGSMAGPWIKSQLGREFIYELELEN